MKSKAKPRLSLKEAKRMYYTTKNVQFNLQMAKFYLEEDLYFVNKSKGRFRRSLVKNIKKWNLVINKYLKIEKEIDEFSHIIRFYQKKYPDNFV